MLLTQLARIPKPTAVLLLAAAMLASWGLASQRRAGVVPMPAPNAAEVTEYQIAFWSGRVEQNELDYLSRTNLGAAFLAAGRQEGDFDAYDAAELPLREALDLNPNYSPTLSTLAAVHLARHEFPTALELADRALERDPTSVEALAVLGDAHLELGQYDQADTAYDQLHRQLPGAPSEARLARLAFLIGRPDEAIEGAQRALELAGNNPDPAYPAALATYALDIGDIELAAATAQTAFAQSSSAPAAVETLAQVRAVQGRLDEAVTLYERLLDMGPDPGAHEALGDLYTQLDQPDLAQQHYLAVEPAAQAITESPVVFDREIALFLANTGLDVDRAVELAQRDLENRQDIYAYDTLAWTNYQAGDLDAASQAIDQALALGTQDPHLLYHAGVISAAVGDDDLARTYLGQALAINPNFDTLQAVHAADTLRDLD